MTTESRDPTNEEMFHGILQWLCCPCCGLFAFAEPPHGFGNPCPQRIKIAESTASLIEARKEAEIRDQFAHLDAGNMMKTAEKMLTKMLGEDADDASD